MKEKSTEWLIEAIRNIPADEAVEHGHPGYNNYTTQKDHWLGWLDPNSGTGTYARKSRPERDARYVYNHIVEPKMLLWLISASGVDRDHVNVAIKAAESATSMQGRSAAIRKNVPWPEVEAALSIFNSDAI